MLLERKQLCGTTWHAAGLIAQLRYTEYDAVSEIFTRTIRFEAETGVATGFKRLFLPMLTDERMEELRRSAAMARRLVLKLMKSHHRYASRYPGFIDDAVMGCGCRKMVRLIR